MFRFACTMLTITAMLAHTVLGCGVCHAGCRHAHADAAEHEDAHHADRHDSHDELAARVSVCCEHGQLAVTDDDTPCSTASEEHSPQCPGKPCTATGCSYLGTIVVKIPLLDISTELLPSDLLALTTPAHLECAAQAAEGYCGGYPPALRAQIWLGTWLV